MLTAKQGKAHKRIEADGLSNILFTPDVAEHQPEACSWVIAPLVPLLTSVSLPEYSYFSKRGVGVADISGLRCIGDKGAKMLLNSYGYIVG